jgi:HrpA-like RNA helicase
VFCFAFSRPTADNTVDTQNLFVQNITLLGKYLGSLSLEPLLGKTLLIATLLGCLDAMLVVSCSLAHRDPFVLPTNPALRDASAKARSKFAGDHNSDHIMLFQAFCAWEHAKSQVTQSYHVLQI